MRCVTILSLLLIAFTGRSQSSFELLKERLQYGSYYQKYKDFNPEYHAKRQKELSEVYKIDFAKTSLKLDTVTIRLKNPYDTLPYPISYSILFQGNIVSLMEPGYFFCLDIKTLKRNQELESKLNLGKHKKVFSYNNCLYSFVKRLGEHHSRSGKIEIRTVADPEKFDISLFDVFDGKIWKEDRRRLPLLRNKVYEDENYYIANQDNGEWGAFTHFYSKLGDSICLWKHNSISGFNYVGETYIYYDGFTDRVAPLSKIYPCLNSELRIEENSLFLNRKDSDIPGYSEKVVRISSVFNWRGNTYTLMSYGDHNNSITFLTEFKEGKFYVIDPLFVENIYSSRTATSSDQKNVLINLDSNINGFGKEYQYLLFTENKVVRVIWE